MRLSIGVAVLVLGLSPLLRAEILPVAPFLGDNSEDFNSFQGGLGGARVLMDERHLAMIHGCVGPAFFACAVAPRCS